jgi:hypothetical protein
MSAEPIHDVAAALEVALPGAEANGVATARELETLVAVFRRWLHLPDPAALLAVLGTIAANRLEGDPVWTLLVGPPGGGKSEILGACSRLSDVYPAATLTEASLLSGTPKKEHGPEAKGGLLLTIGDFGILSLKDFGSILGMNRDDRGKLLAALREIYDGSWTRHVGVDGGRTLHWSGKIGLVAGCTPTIDRHHAVMGSMGERFVLFRLPVVGADEQARRSLLHAGHEHEMREELAGSVAALFSTPFKQPRARSEEDVARLVSLSTLVVRARSAVERDGYTREIELISEPEAPTRLIVVLARLLDGLDAIGVDRDVGWNVVTRSALDSMPALRRALLDELLPESAPVKTSTLAETIGYPSKTTHRALEDLVAHGLVKRRAGGQGKADVWTLSEWARGQYAAALESATDLSPQAGKGIKRAADEVGDISGQVFSDLEEAPYATDEPTRRRAEAKPPVPENDAREATR